MSNFTMISNGGRDIPVYGGEHESFSGFLREGLELDWGRMYGAAVWRARDMNSSMLLRRKRCLVWLQGKAYTSRQMEELRLQATAYGVALKHTNVLYWPALVRSGELLPAKDYKLDYGAGHGGLDALYDEVRLMFWLHDKPGGFASPEVLWNWLQAAKKLSA